MPELVRQWVKTYGSHRFRFTIYRQDLKVWIDIERL